MLKLKTLRARGFRGFNGLAEMPFEKGLSVIYGPNGSGKSSVAEAVEWALFGRTSRKVHARSKGELSDSLRNLHCPKGEKAYVELTLLHGDKETTVRRELINDDNSLLWIGGKQASDLTSLGVLPDATANPVLAQHALTEFIHTEPVHRWNALSHLLGLEPVLSFRASLRTAITELENHYNTLLELVIKYDSMAQSNGWSKFRTVLKANDVSTFDTAVAALIEHTTGQTSINLPILEGQRQALLKKALQVPPIVEKVAVAAGTTKTTVQSHVDELRRAIDKLTSVWPRYIGLIAFESSAKQLSFIRAGLQIPPELPLCPFCGKDTLTEERLTDLRLTVEKNHELVTCRDQTQRALEETSRALRTALHAVKSHVDVNQDQLAGLTSLMGTLPDDLAGKLESFVERVTLAQSGLANSEVELEKLDHRLDDIFKQGHDDPGVWTGLSHCLKDIEDYAINVMGLSDLASDIHVGLTPILAAKVNEDSALRAFGQAVTLLKEAPSLAKALHVRSVIHDAKKILADVEEYERTTTEERLAQQETLALDWYKCMNPDELIRFSSMEVAKVGRSRQVQLLAESYGKKTHALALLSESHLNALGLSVHLARAITPYAALKFVVLDDPVQSMDQAHSSRVASVLIGKLLQDGWQVIVLSHLRRFSDGCMEAHSIDSMDEIKGYSDAGPEFELREPGLKHYVEEAAKYKEGNSDDRIMAAHLLRKAVERFCKDVYSKSTGKPVSKRHQSKSAAELKALALSSGKLSPGDMAKLDEVLHLGNPASHDDQIAEPPTKGELEHALGTLKGLIGTHLKK